jgi:hypothetical protein
MMHLEALQTSLGSNATAADEADQGEHSDEGQKNTNKKRRRRTGKKQ